MWVGISRFSDFREHLQQARFRPDNSALARLTCHEGSRPTEAVYLYNHAGLWQGSLHIRRRWPGDQSETRSSTPGWTAAVRSLPDEKGGGGGGERLFDQICCGCVRCCSHSYTPGASAGHPPCEQPPHPPAGARFPQSCRLRKLTKSSQPPTPEPRLLPGVTDAVPQITKFLCESGSCAAVWDTGLLQILPENWQ